MEQEFKKVDVKRCYACIQWDGQRTWYPDKKLMKVSDSRMGNCKVFHAPRKGSSTCEHFTVVG